MAPDAGITEAREVVAAACGVTRQAVEHWERDGVPGKHVITLETHCRRKVTMRELLEWSLLKRKEKSEV